MRLQLLDLRTQTGRLIHQTLGIFPFLESVPSEVKGVITVGFWGQGPSWLAGSIVSLGPHVAILQVSMPPLVRTPVLRG